MIIAVDLDNTLTNGVALITHDDVDHTVDQKLLALRPNHKAIDKVNKKYKQGHTIIIYTARRAHSRKVTEMWLRKHQCHYSYIAMGKLKADLYVDTDSCKPEDL